MNNKTRRAKFIAGISLVMLILIVFALNSRLAISYYSVESGKIKGQIKLALVTDLHSCGYGEGQIKLLTAIEAEQPDAVLLCGDNYDDRKPPNNTTQLIHDIAAKYTCYYVSGNHDTADEYKIIAETYGVKVLEGTGDTLEIRGDKIRISGVDDPDVERYANAGRITTRSAPYAAQLESLSAAADSGMFTVLLSHRPERIDELLPLKPDIVLSGHAHGGQWRLPLILENGLLAPNQGFFPKYTNGEYFFGETELIVSRGLARESTMIPRLFNRPEIVVIVLKGL
jgi:predicted MPP superfamily phosphohydrolase